MNYNTSIFANSMFSIELDEAHLNQIEEPSNSNIEVFVKLQDGFNLIFVVGTPQNLQYFMERDQENFDGPYPWVIVQKLTKDIISEAIKAYMDAKPEGYWLKFYHFAAKIDISVFNQLQAQEIQEKAQVEVLIGLDDLKDKINKLENLEKADVVTSLDNLYEMLEDNLFKED